MYSLQDLIDIHANVLLDELTRVHAIYAKHIKFDCLVGIYEMFRHTFECTLGGYTK